MPDLVTGMRVFYACLIVVVTAACRPPSLGAQDRREFWAFTGPWDTASVASLRAFAGRLDAAVTGWIALDSATARPILPPLFPDTVRPPATALRRMALVTSWHGDRFHARSIRALARDPTRLGRAAAAVATHAALMQYRGLVLDFEALEPADRDGLVRVVSAFADSARRRAVTPIVVAIPATDNAAYPARALLEVADLLLVMLYDQHWAGSGPGPISDPEWVRRSLAARIAEVGPSRLVAALPLYGYRWPAGAAGEPVNYGEAERIAVAAGISLQRDPATNTLYARSPGAWELWVTDAALLRSLVSQTETAGVRRFALWRLGQEDPAIWRTLIR
jgi:spore germination protein YaaH